MLLIDAAVAALQPADEPRAGYPRTVFKHWNAGDNPTDGCTTRKEVLSSEAITAPEIGPRCAISGGTWFPYYDEVAGDGTGGLDIDHMVPLAESLGPRASAWTAARRAVTARIKLVQE